MDDLYKCAQLYEKLLDFEYQFILGRKGVTTEILLNFSATEFYHLVGLHKLTDLEYIRKAQKATIQNILTKKLSIVDLEKSVFYENNPKNHSLGVKNRLCSFLHLEEMLDSNDLMFRFNKNVLPYTKIEANYLIVYTPDKVPLYLFLGQLDGNRYFCRSFFPESRLDYTRNQTKLTLLHKEKRNLQTGEKTVLYTRLHT